MLYIYDVGDIITAIGDILNDECGIPKQHLRVFSEGVLRGLLFKYLYLNLLPNPRVPYIHKDRFGVGVHHPWIETRLHRLIEKRYDLSGEWIRLKLTPQDDLHLEYVLRPLDFILVGEEAFNVHHLSDRKRKC